MDGLTMDKCEDEWVRDSGGMDGWWTVGGWTMGGRMNA